jgi:hypothetical protein
MQAVHTFTKEIWKVKSIFFDNPNENNVLPS